jgi:hypothetical protein
MSIFACPKHGLHHGPTCLQPGCAHRSQWWDGTFKEVKKDETPAR